jgi:hypothetical protein
MKRIGVIVAALTLAAAIASSATAAGPVLLGPRAPLQLHLRIVQENEAAPVDANRDGEFGPGDYMIIDDRVELVEASGSLAPSLYAQGSLRGMMVLHEDGNARVRAFVSLPAGILYLTGDFQLEGAGFTATVKGVDGTLRRAKGTADVVFNDSSGPDLYFTLR